MRHPRFGQHFIKKPEFLSALVNLAEIGKEQRVFEIGTGDGRLTKAIANRCSYVLSCEVDRGLFTKAVADLDRFHNVEVKLIDALSVDVSRFDCVVSSLPYYLSSKFMTWFIKQSVPHATLILQKDFFEKLVARPGDRKYGANSVLTQYYFDVIKGGVVPRDAFVPPPRVASVMVRLDRKKAYTETVDISKGLKLLFSFRGKTARAAGKILEKSVPGISTEFSNWSLRIEELEPFDAIKLARLVSSVIS